MRGTILKDHPEGPSTEGGKSHKGVTLPQLAGPLVSIAHGLALGQAKVRQPVVLDHPPTLPQQSSMALRPQTPLVP